MADSDTDDQIPGLIEYVTDYDIVDSVANRKSYRLAYVAGRIMSEQFGMQTAMRMIWSREHKRWFGTVSKFLPGDVFVPILIVYQEEFGNAMELVCGPHEHDCRDFMDVTPKEAKPKIDVGELNDAFLHTVESLRGDPDVPGTVEADKLADLYIHENREEGERGGEG